MPIIFLWKNEKHKNYFESEIQKNDQVWKINSLRNGELLDFNSNPKGTLTLVKIK
jgi:hypothetical protein